MKLIKYIIYGAIQGITEPLPISSSGHLRIIRSILDNNVFNDLNLEIITNLGSLFAIIFLFKNDLKILLIESIKYIKVKDKKYKNSFNLLIMIIISTIPVSIVGIFIKDYLDNNLTTKFIGIALLITAFLLFLIKDKQGSKKIEDLTIKDAFIIGLYQVIALLPGISRSASTLVGAINQDLKKEEALKYSFLLYIPVSFLAAILSLFDLNSNDTSIIKPYILSLIIAFITTLISTKFLFNIIKNNKLIYFIIYCLILGIIVFFTF